jgi:hypothetical protein
MIERKRSSFRLPIDITNKLKGQITLTSQIVVARDGKTRTNTGKGKNAQGQTISYTYVYEKQ